MKLAEKTKQDMVAFLTESEAEQLAEMDFGSLRDLVQGGYTGIDERTDLNLLDDIIYTKECCSCYIDSTLVALKGLLHNATYEVDKVEVQSYIDKHMLENPPKSGGSSCTSCQSLDVMIKQAKKELGL